MAGNFLKKNWMGLLAGIWAISALLGLITMQLHWGHVANFSGPQALEADGNGGFYLATDTDLFHFDASKQLQRRESLTDIGLGSINALARGTDGDLRIYDSKNNHLLRCNKDSWRCAPFGPADLRLSPSVQFALTPTGRLIISDNTNHRLIALDKDGNLADNGQGKTWHFPNQISLEGNSLLLADTDSLLIARLDAESPNSAPQQVGLQTKSRPYHFVHRAPDWWVVESGPSLINGYVNHYRDGDTTTAADRLEIPGEDVIAIADTGARIIIASKSDWELFEYNPSTANATPIGSPELQAEFSDNRAMVARAKRLQGAALPLFFAMLSPAVILAFFHQKRINREKALQEVASQQATRAEASLGNYTITPNPEIHESIKKFERRVKVSFLSLGLALCLILAQNFRLFHSSNHMRMDHALALVLVSFALFSAIPLVLTISIRRQRRHLTLRMDCGTKLLTVFEKDAVLKQVNYDRVWVCKSVIMVDGLLIARRLPFRDSAFRNPQGIEIWPEADLQRQLLPRLAPDHIVDNRAVLGLRLLRTEPDLAKSLLAEPAKVALLLIVYVLFTIFRLHTGHHG